MRQFDLTPLYRSTVGFDRLFSLLDNASAVNQTQTYPPYNIERTADDEYRITMAVAGFTENELTVEVKENTLTVTGQKAETESENDNFLYRGIAARAFERRFQLADHVHVTGASLDHGLLHVSLRREVPEAKKPRTIAIEGAGQPKAIDAQAA
ncbi:Hsp20 family protein [Acuticoccus sp. I52.16.1]|uniref:Hsp20 family protein n=1 Tax=Acuticoccus sp. I52.16.1 TaxID=2928472 RepID=UPI001FD4B9F6|nr:Hsp20 family protein [Acuticoccus sp. I52.16.1]UOM34398.1 Hsp20 family protein [Acuticoccus sp. I52.16.1]